MAKDTDSQVSMFWYRIFYGFCWFLAILPLRCLYVVSDIIFLIVCYIIRYRRKTVLKNLRLSFPEKTEKEIWQIARKFYRFMCDLFIETLKVTNISAKQMHKRMKYANPDILYDLAKKGKQIMYVTGHYGNWEWLATLNPTTPYHMSTLYRPLKNKIFDKFFTDMRTKYGTSVMPSNTAVRAINKYINENRLTTLCFLADQSPTRDAIPHWMEFLNQDTAVFTGVEKLARRYKTAVLYYEVKRIKRGYYEVDTTLITEDASQTAEMEITEKHVKLLEDTIKRNPQYWLWSHKRWKKKRAENK
jgi:KDO2-lipid IV(A) lauroyltransferase